MNAECRMMNDEWREERGEGRAKCPAPLIHHSSFILNPSPRRGLSLLEVLVSMGILTVGLLAVASLIPIGKFAMVETNKADRTGMLGRAGLREVKVRRMLDPNLWASTPTNTVFVIDPLGCTSVLGTTSVGGTASAIERVNLRTVPGGGALNSGQADSIFRLQDELIYSLPKDMVPPQTGDRPVPTGGNEGNFSWFLTVACSPAELSLPLPQKRQFSVAVVVCWKRAFTATANDPEAGEATVSVVCDAATGFGGIGISYPTTTTAPTPKQNEWVLLTSGTQATWYRVVSVGSDGTTTRATLVGPDWNGGTTGGTLGPPPAPDDSVKLVVIKGVTGVYTTTVQLDNDAIWTR
jgi:prepilin-type N-terminal cleavage/methylation domain-containing protein